MILGAGLTVGLLLAELQYKSTLFNSSQVMQIAITSKPKHFLFYMFKTFEWLLYILTWLGLMLTLYFEFNKVVAWKILTFCWMAAGATDLLKIMMMGCRPVFMSNTLAASNCECTFGTSSWYVTFVVLFWIMFYREIVKEIDVVKVSLQLLFYVYR